MDLLPSLLAFVEQSKYVLIFLGSFFEGSAVMMTTGLLWHVGTVEFWPAYLALLAGDISADIMWYIVGHFAARSFFIRWGHFFGATPDVLEKVERRFNHYHTKILIISKLTMGLGLAVPVLIVAGMMRVPFTRFVVINVLGGIVWVLFLMGVGYYFGDVLHLIPKELQIAVAIAIPFLFFFGLRWVNRKLKEVDW
ncbi:MAG: membrane-associated protein [Parcubacteria group bacterium Gr01-1014_49]|nr:MAG: membrane-associated protein [Parcubacteria group bacterium Gr01-1014_49]